MYTTILFDLDGTLTDSGLGITMSVQYALSKFDIAVDTLDELTPFIGPPLQQSFMDFFALTAEQSLEAIQYYREYFSTNGIFENRVYEGIPELLNTLVTNDATLAIATAKPTVFAEKIIDHFKLSHYFKTIVGSTLDHTRTAKKDIIAHAMHVLGCDTATTVMIGDRTHDIVGAQKNNIASVGVLYGYGSAEELTMAAPNTIVENVPQLSSVLVPQKLVGSKLR